MAATATKKARVTPRRSAAGKKTPPPARMLIDNVTAILLISPNAKKLCEFYQRTLGLPFEEELHDGMPVHYGYSLGNVHIAIHPAQGGWPGVPVRNAQSPVICFSTSNVKAVAKRLAA